MKFAKYVIAGMAVAASVGANADWVSGAEGAGTEGELILTVWNENTNTSFSQDLGIGASSFLNSSASAQSFTLDAAGMAHVSAATDSSSIRWNVFGASTDASIDGPDAYGYLFTTNTAPFNNNMAINQFTNQIAVIDEYVLNLGDPDSGTDENPVFFLLGTQHAGIAPVWGQTYRNFGVRFGSSDNFAGDGERLDSWSLRSEYVSPRTAQATIAGQNAFWELDLSSGSLQYSAVPVPAAVWLFGSALLGLAGAIRRRKAVRA